jgi:hypothetical protein
MPPAMPTTASVLKRFEPMMLPRAWQATADINEPSLICGESIVVSIFSELVQTIQSLQK